MIEAIGAWMLQYMRERADCIEAGECLYDHVNDVCPYAS